MPQMHYLFTFDVLPNVNPEILKILKVFTVAYRSSRKSSVEARTAKRRQTLSRIKILFIEGTFVFSVRLNEKVKHLFGNPSFVKQRHHYILMNPLKSNKAVRLGSKVHHCVDMVLPLLARHISGAIRLIRDACTTSLSAECLELH